jgi:hypothetical protein
MARAEARATLVISCDMTMQEAVDGLWFAAIKYGLVDDLGVDSVQVTMAQAFARVWR